MKSNFDQYSFEDLTRTPQITIKNELTDMNHYIRNEQYRHKKLDNDVLFDRRLTNMSSFLRDNHVMDQNYTDRSFGAVQSPKISLNGTIGSISRKQGTESLDRFQFQFNANMEKRPPSRPEEISLMYQETNNDLKETVATR